MAVQSSGAISDPVGCKRRREAVQHSRPYTTATETAGAGHDNEPAEPMHLVVDLLADLNTQLRLEPAKFALHSMSRDSLQLNGFVGKVCIV